MARSSPAPTTTESGTSGSERYLTVLRLEIEVVHDEKVEFFADLLVAYVNHALRSRGHDDVTTSVVGWREITGEPVEDPGRRHETATE